MGSQRPASQRFRGADPYGSADYILLICKCMLQLVCKLYNGFRLLLEQETFIRQRNRTFSPDQKSCTHLIFQFHQLTAEGRLCYMKNICCSCNISFVRYCKKVFQYTQFHTVPSYYSVH